MLTWLESRNGREKNEAVVQIASDSIRTREMGFVGGFGISWRNSGGSIRVLRFSGLTFVEVGDYQGF